MHISLPNYRTALRNNGRRVIIDVFVNEKTAKNQLITL